MKYLFIIASFIGFLHVGWAQSDEVSLRDKIGQMLIVGFDGTTIDEHSSIVKMIQVDHIGGVILFDYNYQTKTFDKNIESPQQVARLNQSLQKMNQNSLPLLISVDYEGGARGTRLTERDGFPHTLSAAEIGKMPLHQAITYVHTMAVTLSDAGFNLDFAPTVDVNLNPDNPIIGQLNRSFSEDPARVVEDAQLYSKEFLYAKVQCAYKHFPGHGSSDRDSHLGFVDITDTWQTDELYPYQQLINQQDSCGAVMVGHLVHRKLDASGLPATLSYPILTTLLREQLHFDGVIISDDMQMQAITQHYSLEQALTLAINAGVDVFIFGNQLTDKPQDPKIIIDIIERKVNAGEIKLERINDAYRHITTFKKTLLVNE